MEAVDNGDMHLEKVQNILEGSYMEGSLLDEVIADENYAALTLERIGRLAACISANTMETIAEGCMGIEYETIMDLKDKNRFDPESFNAEIIQLWALQNPGFHTKVLNLNYFWTILFFFVIYLCIYLCD